MKKNEINSVEVARLAGVSRSTVSRVINNYPNVPLETKEKVLKAIKELNYFPNMSAQMLAGKKSRTIGLFMVSSGQVSSDVLTNMMIVSVIEDASVYDYHVLTYIIRDKHDESTIKNVREVFFQRRIDAGIFIGTAHCEPFVEELIKEGFIIGILDEEHPDRLHPNRVVANFNNESGMKQSIAYLAGLGHRSIGIINGDLKRLSGIKKYEGYLLAMEHSGLKIDEKWMLPGDFNESSGYQAMKTFLDSGQQLPTAIIAANDSVAFGTMRAINEHGLKVPEDISVIGFDDHILSVTHRPALTTVKVDFKRLFNEMIAIIVNKIEHPNQEIKEVSVECSLIIRDSCARIN